MPWNPLGPNGLLSTPAEWHALIMGLVVAVAVIALDRRGHPRVATAVFLLSLVGALGLGAPGIDYKSWYFGAPLTAVAGAYLIVDRRERVRSRLPGG